MRQIWDSYLSARDREDCELNPVPERSLGTAPALLMVDCYRRAFKDEIKDRKGGGRRPNAIAEAAAAALPSLVDLLAGARGAGIPVVHMTKQTSASHGIRDWNEPADSAIAEPTDDFEFVDDLRPLSGEAVVFKTAPSGFLGTPLLSHLVKLRVDTVVVAGESTSGCIRATVVDGRAYGFAVGVVTDCTFDRHDAAHAINLFDMHRKYARLLTLDEMLAYVAGSDDGAGVDGARTQSHAVGG